MEFRDPFFSQENVTQFHKRDLPASEPGTPVHTLLKPEFDSKGNYELVEAGEVNIYDEIQSHAESCDINVLMKKYQNGDPTALSKVQGTYFDATGMPKTYAEMLNTLIDAENQFNALPLDERAKFDHSFEKWLAALDLALKVPNIEDKQQPTTDTDPAPATPPAAES
ncbi:VP3 [Gokushovirus WZ-2015a]|nr:VP3 [Gokushovirus WZ-2015a]